MSPETSPDVHLGQAAIPQEFTPPDPGSFKTYINGLSAEKRIGAYHELVTFLTPAERTQYDKNVNDPANQALLERTIPRRDNLVTLITIARADDSVKLGDNTAIPAQQKVMPGNLTQIIQGYDPDYLGNPGEHRVQALIGSPAQPTEAELMATYLSPAENTALTKLKKETDSDNTGPDQFLIRRSIMALGYNRYLQDPSLVEEARAREKAASVAKTQPILVKPVTTAVTPASIAETQKIQVKPVQPFVATVPIEDTQQIHVSPFLPVEIPTPAAVIPAPVSAPEQTPAPAAVTAAPAQRGLLGRITERVRSLFAPRDLILNTYRGYMENGKTYEANQYKLNLYAELKETKQLAPTAQNLNRIRQLDQAFNDIIKYQMSLDRQSQKQAMADRHNVVVLPPGPVTA